MQHHKPVDTQGKRAIASPTPLVDDERGVGSAILSQPTILWRLMHLSISPNNSSAVSPSSSASIIDQSAGTGGSSGGNSSVSRLAFHPEAILPGGGLPRASITCGGGPPMSGVRTRSGGLLSGSMTGARTRSGGVLSCSMSCVLNSGGGGSFRTECLSDVASCLSKTHHLVRRLTRTPPSTKFHFKNANRNPKSCTRLRRLTKRHGRGAPKERSLPHHHSIGVCRGVGSVSETFPSLDLSRGFDRFGRHYYKSIDRDKVMEMGEPQPSPYIIVGMSPPRNNSTLDNCSAISL